MTKIVPEYPKKKQPKTEEKMVRKEIKELKKPGQALYESGVVMLTKEFNQDNIMPLVVQIMEINMMKEEEAPENIKLIINSPGGSVHSAFHLIDVMKQSRIPVHTVAMGLAASCGVLTLMAGEKGHRYITQNTSCLLYTSPSPRD